MQPETTTNNSIATKNTEIISFFSADSSFVLIHKKTEKLASAVYMVTNLFPENEPIRFTLRSKVSNLMSFMIGYKDIGEGAKKDFTYNVQTYVLELVSFLEIAYRGGLVSAMNYDILKTEFGNLIDLLNAPKTPAQTQNSKESISSFFTEEVVYPKQISSPVVASNSPIHTNVSPQIYAPNYIKDKPVLSIENDNFRRSDRQTVILNLIKKKRELTIKDIAVVIKDCSEKTIQRELNSFIEAGVLKREGVRRWSKYSLK